ncbi:hypothetical protein WA026_018277 [Henosepilachna vigintioctopunctata]|uniref:Zinc finger PHD-type domain-containing protein n=1 Tax=Henosepilachna vigintioctopunctata TaxID=420089 RepID=A0AAW1V8P2_9CUCU
MTTTCVNCSRAVGDQQPNIQCDACKGSIHLTCTDFRSEDRVTRHKVRGIEIICNPCSSNIEIFANLKSMLDKYNEDLQQKINKIDEKVGEMAGRIVGLEDKLSVAGQYSTAQDTDKIANEAVDRMNRAKNMFVRGIPEYTGDIQQKKDHDKHISTEILQTVECNSVPITFFGGDYVVT